MEPLSDPAGSKSNSTPERKLAAIPVRTAVPASAGGGCEEGGVFALQVIGDVMAPEFEHGDIVVVEIDGHLADGVYVVALSGAEWVLRQLVRREAGWFLLALDGRWPEEAVRDLSTIRGVVIQKSRPGRRRTIKRYVSHG